MGRRKWLLLGLTLSILLPSAALAEEASTAQPEPFFGTQQAAAVLNNPVAVLTGSVNTINAFEPGAEAMYDFIGKEWLVGTGVALYRFKKNDLDIVDIRGGMIGAGDFVPFVEASLNLASLETFVPEKWGAVHTVAGVIAKYGQAGYFIGYEVSGEPDERLKTGITLGAKISF